MGIPTMWFLKLLFLNRSETNEAVQSQKMARCLKGLLDIGRRGIVLSV